jgi:hypothetical protein
VGQLEVRVEAVLITKQVVLALQGKDMQVVQEQVAFLEEVVVVHLELVVMVLAVHLALALRD